MLSQKAERLGDMPGLDRGNIGADQHRRTRRAGSQRPPHAHADIAGALRSDRGGARPQPLARDAAVWRDREAQPPAAVAAKPARQKRQHRALEPQRRNVAGLAGQAALADPETRRAHEQHEMPPGHPVLSR